MQEFKCTFCGSTVEEDESAIPKKDSRLMLAKFNEQMEKVRAYRNRNSGKLFRFFYVTYLACFICHCVGGSVADPGCLSRLSRTRIFSIPDPHQRI